MLDPMPLYIIFIMILNKMHGLVIIVGILLIILLSVLNQIFVINHDDAVETLYGIANC